MILTDTHTHIYISELRNEISGIMDRAHEQNVRRFFLPNIDTHSVDSVFSLNELYPDECFPMMGLHPCSVKENFQEQLSFIKNYIDDKRVTAIGEIGIDLYWDKTFLEEQKEAFRIQINWAKEKNLPIVIHCREAFDEIYEILLAENDEKLRGIFHCFTGTNEQAKKVIDLGFYLGIGGVLTYKNSGLPEALADIDMKHIVLETDSPYLPPVPHRGKKNESSFLIHVAEKLAEIKEVSLEQVAAITTENSKHIFGK